MCGIIGFNWEDDLLAERMINIIQHRGPNEQVIKADSISYEKKHKKITLGMARLSIIDLTTGLYPLTNESNNISMVYNGEIYNYQNIKIWLKNHEFKTKTDGEAVVHLYEERGEKAFEMLNGMFAIALHDKKKGLLYLVRDHVGIKPLYYYYKDGNLIFGSEIKAILEAQVERVINTQALNYYLALRYNPLYQTLFKGIKKIPPGHFVKFDLKKKTISLEKYWEMTLPKEQKLDKAKLRDHLKNAVGSQLMSDVPLGLYLSGGIDSSIILKMMAEKEKNIQTFNIDFEAGEKVNESQYAESMAKEAGATYHQYHLTKESIKDLPHLIWLCDEPMADPALIPLYYLSKEAKSKATVVLTGDGGDELFAGYDQHKILNLINKCQHIPLFKTLAPLMIDKIPLPIWNKIYKHASDLGEKAYERAIEVVKRFPHSKAEAYYYLVGMFTDKERTDLLKEDYFGVIDYRSINEKYFPGKHNFLTELLHFDFSVLLPESYLMKTDRMTMGVGMESRVPLLDKELAEYAFSIRSKEKMEYATGKLALKQTFQNEIPGYVLFRKKQGFHVPIENWIDKDMDKIKSLLLTSQIFKPEAIKKLFEDYHKGKLFYARQLWTVITLEIWHRIFIKQELVEL